MHVLNKTKKAQAASTMHIIDYSKLGWVCMSDIIISFGHIGSLETKYISSCMVSVSSACIYPAYNNQRCT